MRAVSALDRFVVPRETLTNVEVAQIPEDALPVLSIPLRGHQPQFAENERKARDTRDTEMRRDIRVDPSFDDLIERPEMQSGEVRHRVLVASCRGECRGQRLEILRQAITGCL